MIHKTWRGYEVSHKSGYQKLYVRSVYKGVVKWTLDYTHAGHYSDRLQGVYGTIMALASNANWREVVWWIDEIENERYGYRAGHGIVEYGNK